MKVQTRMENIENKAKGRLKAYEPQKMSLFQHLPLLSYCKLDDQKDFRVRYQAKLGMLRRQVNEGIFDNIMEYLDVVEVEENLLLQHRGTSGEGLFKSISDATYQAIYGASRERLEEEFLSKILDWTRKQFGEFMQDFSLMGRKKGERWPKMEIELAISIGFSVLFAPNFLYWLYMRRTGGKSKVPFEMEVMLV